MPKALTDAQRQEIVDLLGTGMGCKAIARQVSRSSDTVSKIAKAEGHRFGRSNLAHAVGARVAYSAERRAQDAALAQERIAPTLAKWDQSYEVVVGIGNVKTGFDSEPIVMTAMVKPSAKDLKDLAGAVQALQRMVLDVAKHDDKGDAGGDEVDRHMAWLGRPEPADPGA